MKKRHVLGEGYPWLLGLRRTGFFQVGVVKSTTGTDYIKLKEFPRKWWSGADTPRVRLVLEVIDDNEGGPQS